MRGQEFWIEGTLLSSQVSEITTPWELITSAWPHISKDIINSASQAETLEVPELRPYSHLISYVTLLKSFITRAVGITALQTKGNGHTIPLGAQGLCGFAKSLSGGSHWLCQSNSSWQLKLRCQLTRKKKKLWWVYLIQARLTRIQTSECLLFMLCLHTVAATYFSLVSDIMYMYVGGPPLPAL